ncbi:MAG: hypothetical protein WC975_09525 [Phycisphaerae bacterium]
MIKLISLVLVLVSVGYLGSTDRKDNSPKPPAQEVVKHGPSKTFREDIIRGMAIQISYTASGIESYLKEIDEIAALGANSVGISTAGYQEHAGSMGITIDVRKCPTPEQFRQMINRARNKGMKVIVMPVLLLSNPKGSEWRGVIEPPDWDEWFSSYLEFIKYFAKIALDNDAEALVVGAELISTETFRSRWLKIIEEVRKIYHGKLLYSANWDHYRQVTFWDKLDLIGMTTYHKLADDDNPDISILLAHWAKIKKEILTWQKKIGKPIIFTEVGWCSQPGASVEAWNYYRHQSPSKEGLEEQKKCYEAFIQCWRNEKAVAGAMWWEWTTDGSGPQDYGYTPKGKPAEKVLRAWYREGKEK